MFYNFIFFISLFLSLSLNFKGYSTDLIPRETLPEQIEINTDEKNKRTFQKVYEGVSGRGINGQVLEYEDIETKEKVIVKFNKNDYFFKDGMKEHRNLHQKYLNLVPDYIGEGAIELTEQGKTEFMVMEKMDGTLRQFIEQKVKENDPESIVDALIEVQKKAIFAYKASKYIHTDPNLSNFLYKKGESSVEFFISDISGSKFVEEFYSDDALDGLLDQTIAQIYFDARFKTKMNEEFRTKVHEIYTEKNKNDNQVLLHLYESKESQFLLEQIKGSRSDYTEILKLIKENLRSTSDFLNSRQLGIKKDKIKEMRDFIKNVINDFKDIHEIKMLKTALGILKDREGRIEANQKLKEKNKNSENSNSVIKNYVNSVKKKNQNKRNLVLSGLKKFIPNKRSTNKEKRKSNSVEPVKGQISKKSIMELGNKKVVIKKPRRRGSMEFKRGSIKLDPSRNKERIKQKTPNRTTMTNVNKRLPVKSKRLSLGNTPSEAPIQPKKIVS